MEINEENCKLFGNSRKVTNLWIITLSFSARETKQTKKQTK